MALVAYENSDSSEYEDDEDVSSVVISNTKAEVPIKLESKPATPEQIPDVSHSDLGQNLFNLLPQPNTKKPVTIEDDDEFLHKKESASVVKPKAKIMVPSLDDFKDVERVTATVKPKAPNGKKSGLLNILPQPKNAAFTTKATTKTLIPHILTKKPDATVKKKDLLPSMKKAKTEAKLLAEYSDDSDDDDIQTDFFSINKPVELPPVEDIPLDIDIKPKAEIKNIQITTTNQRQAPNIQSYFKQSVDEEEMNGAVNESEYGHEASSSSYSSYEVAESQPNGEIVLDDEAIMKLCGARGKRKREDIQIVDVNQQEVLADSKEWLLKGLMDDTSKRVSASKKRGNEPTHQQKRKHQITYLAHQAKANEVELQNQWANNRMSKRQTQSKYGF